MSEQTDAQAAKMDDEMRLVAQAVAYVLSGIRDHVPSIMDEVAHIKADLPPGYNIELVLLIHTPLMDEPLEMHVSERIIGSGNEGDQHQN